MPSLTPCLMFVGDQAGRAEEAAQLWAATFPDSEILDVTRHGPGGPDAEGTVLLARIRVAGQQLRVMDSAHAHQFGFTPAVSLVVELDDEAAVGAAFATLEDGGQVLMPLGAYPFSPCFGWLSDRFGVSWQLQVVAPAA